MSKREPAYPTRERYEWMKAVLRAPDLSWATKGVALCIIMVHFNDWDGRCDPSVERTMEGQVLGRNEQMGSIDERLVGGLRWRKAIDPLPSAPCTTLGSRERTQAPVRGS